MTATTFNASAIPSVQLLAAGVPRFHVPATDEPGWALAAAIEAGGGVEAEVRAFFDAQLETGDVVLDLNPGFGFVALSATTAPGGMPTVFVAGLTVDRMQSLQDAAADAGGWLETLGVAELEHLGATIDSRLEPEGRIFVHTIAANVGWVCAVLSESIAAGRVLSICVSDAFDSAEWDTASRALGDAGFTSCAMVERDGEAMILPFSGRPESPVIALPTAIVDGSAADPDPQMSAAASRDDVVGAIDVTRSVEPVEFAQSVDLIDLVDPSDVAGVTGAAEAAEAAEAADVAVIAEALGSVFQPAAVLDDPRWLPTRDGLSFIAPHSRTGYGVVGAHLLRALQARQVPVAFFPLGPVDRTIVRNSALDQSLRLQGAYRPDVPSVRLAQQFDLALHAGRGKHIGYTVFELDRFTESELHQLQQQDALLVCSEWARQVCLDNGLNDRPIHVVPHGVDRTVFHENVSPSTTWAETVFMQVGKLETRKGQRDLLTAFESAFTPRDHVRLVLSCGNPFKRPAEMEAMLKPFRESPMAARITILTHELPSLSDVATLMSGADCGVFAARAEGWNLEALEMLSMGKPIIATAVTAHNEFLTLDNARLVRIDAFEDAVSDGVALPGRWAAWGASQHEQLVHHLRDVHVRKQAGTLPRNDAGIRTAQRYSWENAADTMLRALDEIV